jgi:predicted dithiol-disulfide oxidoreductase (DUF899 family)
MKVSETSMPGHQVVSSCVPGLDTLVGTYNCLDLVSKGRDGAGLPWPMAWLRHHDRYDVEPGEANPRQGSNGSSGSAEDNS